LVIDPIYPMKKQLLLVFSIAISFGACAQKRTADNSGLINAAEVERIETVLASDDMAGRKPGTPGIEKAAAFIASEFQKAGLKPLTGNSFFQEFMMVRAKPLTLKAEIDDKDIDTRNVIIMSSQTDLKVNEKMGYQVEHITTGNLGTQVQALMRAGKNSVVFVDTSFAKTFNRLASRRAGFKTNYNLVFILGDYRPKEFTIKAEQSVEEVRYANVVGILPGRSKASEQVVFSAHYDHLGIGKPVDGDSIYNGANDDAAGTTGVIMLANYFKKQNNNERTLVFAAFTAEESGGFGSQYFSRQLDPAKVVAMFNLEMIGTQSKWGKNSAYITGYDKSDMGSILQKNLEGSEFHFYPDPYPQQNLFYRSDNATLARLGVPAHTISTSKMDSEPNYHQLSDEIKTLDMENMAAIIQAIAKSSSSIVSGKDTPTRIEPAGLN
jgi:hypothetical protein